MIPSNVWTSKVWPLLIACSLNCALAAEAITVKPARLGNVFFTGEEVELPLATSAITVAWKVTDFWQKSVASGEQKAANGQAIIRPGVKQNGYYLVKLDTGEQGGEAYTSFCIIPPLDQKNGTDGIFGVMTHFAQGMDVDIMKLFVDAGITSIRDEHYWNQVEKRGGVYEFSKKSNNYMAAAAQHGLEPLVEMTFSNPLYDKGLTPYTNEGFDAYARYGVAILNQYGKQIKAIEVWNEYNGTWCKGPAAENRSGYYADMIKRVYPRLKEARPDVEVLGCACVLIPLPYIEGIFKNDGLKYMDGVVIHPYRGRPEGVEEEVAELKEMIRKYNGGKDKPIWVTETGKHDHAEFDWEKGRKMWECGRMNVARYLPRQYTLLLTQNVKRICWYLARDHMEFTTMGLLRNVDDKMGRYAVAPAYVAYATLIRQLAGGYFIKREAVAPYTRTRVYLFKRGAEEVRVCWATQPSQIKLTTATPLTVVDLMGGTRTETPQDGVVKLFLSEDVVYVKGPVQEVAEIGTGEKVIADSVEDYTKEQGTKNWYYGYCECFRDYEGKEWHGAFEELKQVQTMWGYNWGGVSKHLALNPKGGHPDANDEKQLWAVLRWKSPVSGQIGVKARFTHSGKGDGIGVRVLSKHETVFSRHVDGSKTKEAVFEQVLTVEKGTMLDFAGTPGPDKNTSFDAFGLEVRIIKVGADLPEPPREEPFERRPRIIRRPRGRPPEPQPEPQPEPPPEPPPEPENDL